MPHIPGHIEPFTVLPQERKEEQRQLALSGRAFEPDPDAAFPDLPAASSGPHPLDAFVSADVLDLAGESFASGVEVITGLGDTREEFFEALRQIREHGRHNSPEEIVRFASERFSNRPFYQQLLAEIGAGLAGGALTAATKPGQIARSGVKRILPDDPAFGTRSGLASGASRGQLAPSTDLEMRPRRGFDDRPGIQSQIGESGELPSRVPTNIAIQNIDNPVVSRYLGTDKIGSFSLTNKEMTENMVRYAMGLQRTSFTRSWPVSKTRQRLAPRRLRARRPSHVASGRQNSSMRSLTSGATAGSPLSGGSTPPRWETARPVMQT